MEGQEVAERNKLLNQQKIRKKKRKKKKNYGPD